MSDDLREHIQTALGSTYQLERELGGGGMSRVFLARETALAREVVIKVLTPELARGVSVDRFRREIVVAAKLQHPHIVPLLAAGQVGELPYFTMPFVSGETLRTRIGRLGSLPIPEAVRLLRHLASALAYAHEQGVVHRDIKPENILLSSGVAMVTDFGVAKALTVSAEAAAAVGGGAAPAPIPTVLTSLGLALGTPAYMAPEQATADPAMDHRVDIYAFGAVAYEALTGQPPFWGRSPQALLAAHVTEQPEPVATRRPVVPGSLAQLVMRCLEKHPADRPQTADEIVQVLDALATPSLGTAPTRQVRVRSREDLRRHRRIVQTLVLLAVAGAVGLGIALRPDSMREGPRETAQRPGGPTAGGAAGMADTSAPPAAAPPVAGRTPSREPAATPPESAPPPMRAPIPQPDVRVPRQPSSRPRIAAPPRAPAERVQREAAPPAATPTRDTPIPPETLRPAPAISTPPASGAPSDSLPPTQARESVAVRPAAPESVPAPVDRRAPEPEAPTPSPAETERAVAAAIERYAEAIETRSVAAVRRAYPGLTAAQERAWESFFDAVRDVQVELRVVGRQPSGDAVVARVTGEYRFENASTDRAERQTVSFEATLRPGGDGWRIAAIR